MCFDFLFDFFWNVSHSKKNWARYDKKCILVFMSSTYTVLFLSDCNKTLIFPTVFWKILRYQISWKSVQWELTCSMWTDRRTDERANGRTNRHDETNSRFSQFCANSLKTLPPFFRSIEKTHKISPLQGRSKKMAPFYIWQMFWQIGYPPHRSWLFLMMQLSYSDI